MQRKRISALATKERLIPVPGGSRMALPERLLKETPLGEVAHRVPLGGLHGFQQGPQVLRDGKGVCLGVEENAGDLSLALPRQGDDAAQHPAAAGDFPVQGGGPFSLCFMGRISLLSARTERKWR